MLGAFTNIELVDRESVNPNLMHPVRISKMSQCSGDHNNPLRCKILDHPRLESKEGIRGERLPVNELQKSLPDGWTVDQTLDGRYLFMSLRNSEIPNS